MPNKREIMLTSNEATKLAGGHSELRKPNMYFVSQIIWKALELPYQKIDKVKFIEALEKVQK